MIVKTKKLEDLANYLYLSYLNTVEFLFSKHFVSNINLHVAAYFSITCRWNYLLHGIQRNTIVF